MKKTRECIDEKLQEAAELFRGLTNVTDGAQEFATTATAELQSCTQSGDNFLSTGSCLAAVAMKTEMKGAVFLGQSGLSVSTYLPTSRARLPGGEWRTGCKWVFRYVIFLTVNLGQHDRLSILIWFLYEHVLTGRSGSHKGGIKK